GHVPASTARRPLPDPRRLRGAPWRTHPSRNDVSVARRRHAGVPTLAGHCPSSPTTRRLGYSTASAHGPVRLPLLRGLHTRRDHRRTAGDLGCLDPTGAPEVIAGASPARHAAGPDLDQPSTPRPHDHHRRALVGLRTDPAVLTARIIGAEECVDLLAR